MSEQEFESYLNLLARTLRLSESQRARIAGELRDHLEARMAELMEEDHLSKEDAVLAALDEFGDANVLAHDLTGPATQLKRKRIMQTGFSVIATAAVVAAAATFLTPTNFQGHPTQTVAAAAGEAGATTPAAAAAPGGPLDQNISLNFDDTSLAAAFEYFQQTTETNFLVDWDGLDELDLTRDSTVSMRLKDVPASTGLKLLLDTVSRTTAAYQIDDQIIVVSNSEFFVDRDKELTTMLYDCNRLLEDAAVVAVPDDDAHPVGALTNFFRDMLGAESMKTPGSSIAYFGGIVVIRHTASEQKRVSATFAEIKDQLAAVADARRKELASRPQAEADGYGDNMDYGGGLSGGGTDATFTPRS